MNPVFSAGMGDAVFVNDTGDPINHFFDASFQKHPPRSHQIVVSPFSFHGYSTLKTTMPARISAMTSGVAAAHMVILMVMPHHLVC
jgi:hypothetical protein